jgi:hypothetical protein
MLLDLVTPRAPKNFFNPGLLAFHPMLPLFFFLFFRGEYRTFNEMMVLIKKLMRGLINF